MIETLFIECPRNSCIINCLQLLCYIQVQYEFWLNFLKTYLLCSSSKLYLETDICHLGMQIFGSCSHKNPHSCNFILLLNKYTNNYISVSLVMEFLGQRSRWSRFFLKTQIWGFYWNFSDFQMGCLKLGIILENKSFQKMSMTKNIFPKVITFNKKIRKIQMIFYLDY